MSPARQTSGLRQGYGLTVFERKAVELMAMEVTRTYLEGLGYEVKDTSAKNPFDFLASMGNSQIKVEVKGTTSSKVDSVMMTSNEVDLHKNENGKTALAIVSGISFLERGSNARCEGGKLEYLFPWDIGEWKLKPTVFDAIRP